MNPEVKAKWLAALRSGEYAQGRHKLKRYDEFCCLGVLCDLYAKETGKGRWDSENYFIAGNDVAELGLPEPVMEWAGLTRAVGAEVRVTNREGNEVWRTLDQVNDGSGHIAPHTFAAIADIIEEQL